MWTYNQYNYNKITLLAAVQCILYQIKTIEMASHKFLLIVIFISKGTLWKSTY